MAEQSVVPHRRMSPEFVTLVALGITVVLAMFSLVAWLDGKFEQVDAKFEARFVQFDAKVEGRFEKLDRKIADLRAGQASLDKRLAVVESHVLGISRAAHPETPAEPAS